MQRGLLTLLLLLALIGAGVLLMSPVPAPPPPPFPPAPAVFAELVADLRRDLPIRAGMTVAQIQHYIAENNAAVRAREKERWDKDKSFAPPIFADPAHHLYLFVDGGDAADTGGRSLSYWVNGRHQFWLDLAVGNGRVQNIYIAPGNFTAIAPAFLYDGTGGHVGRLPDSGPFFYSK
jgi:hypothetical protein